MLNFILQSKRLEDYMAHSDLVDFYHPTIQQLANELFHQDQSDVEKIKVAFHFVRDQIAHSKDIEEQRVTCTASDVVTYKHGICYAKSNLLAALLRSQRIPTGFCYQRLMLFDTPEKGYCLHALNAIYLIGLDKWIRLDARGNKVGVNAQFSVHKEQLAFTVNEVLQEIDYPTIYAIPHEKTIAVLRNYTNAIDMYMHHLPEHLS